MTPANSQSRIINIVTLGCSKNTVDSEFLAGGLQSAGLAVVHEGEAMDYAAVIINTCGFILDAKEESIETILHYAALRKQERIGKLIVMGCLTQRYRSEIEKEIGEIDAVFGVNQLDAVISLLAPSPSYIPSKPNRLLSTPSHYAWLKVSEGCDRRCSFCAIPLIRGAHISRSQEELVEEVGLLTASGVKELILIAQDLTSYGKDLHGKPRLLSLLQDLLSLPEPAWIRLHYAYPNGITDQLLDLIAREDRICSYLDIPFQHINNRILRSMRRDHDSRGIHALMSKLRKDYPKLAVRTSFIVGYPGETEAEFRELLAFVEECRFDRLGAFTYSHEEDTHAFSLADDIPTELKEERMQRLMSLQEDIAFKNNQQLIGKQLRVLVDEALPDGSFIARTEFDSPEIDNTVIIQAHQDLEVGTFANVLVQSSSAFDLEATFVCRFE